MQIDKSNIGDSIISYKGHGMIETASRLNSIGHVIAHENRHLQQFRNRAMYQGKEISSENITIKYEFRDGKIIAVAGEATAIIKDKPPQKQELPEDLPTNQTSINIEKSYNNKNNSIKQKLDTLLSRIDAALNKFDTKLSEAENSQDNKYNNENSNLAQLRLKKSKLELKKKEIQNKKNELNAEKVNELSEQLLKGISDLSEQAANLMKAINGLKYGKQIEQNPDNNNELEVPDYSMLYTGMLLDTMIY